MNIFKLSCTFLLILFIGCAKRSDYAGSIDKREDYGNVIDSISAAHKAIFELTVNSKDMTSMLLKQAKYLRRRNLFKNGVGNYVGLHYISFEDGEPASKIFNYAIISVDKNAGAKIYFLIDKYDSTTIAIPQMRNERKRYAVLNTAGEYVGSLDYRDLLPFSTKADHRVHEATVGQEFSTIFFSHPSEPIVTCDICQRAVDRFDGVYYDCYCEDCGAMINYPYEVMDMVAASCGGTGTGYGTWYDPGWIWGDWGSGGTSGGNDNGYGGASGGGGSSGNDEDTPAELANMFVEGPKKPVSLITELECFTHEPNAKYTISLNVNQPDPGTRGIMNLKSEFVVGHTFLTLKQVNPDNSVVIRNIGYYPVTSAKPSNEMEPSVFGDDSETPFNVSLTIGVSISEFHVVKQYLSSMVSDYNLVDHNCTTVGVNALRKIGINLPLTNSSNVLFVGHNPGDLGQDIRALDATIFSLQHGGRYVHINRSMSNNLHAPARTGSCP